MNLRFSAKVNTQVVLQYTESLSAEVLKFRESCTMWIYGKCRPYMTRTCSRDRLIISDIYVYREIVGENLCHFNFNLRTTVVQAALGYGARHPEKS